MKNKYNGLMVGVEDSYGKTYWQKSQPTISSCINHAKRYSRRNGFLFIFKSNKDGWIGLDGFVKAAIIQQEI